MTAKTARRTADYIAKFTNAPGNIIPRVDFFGGEPLTNFEGIKIITKRLNELEESGYFDNKNVGKYLVTNGTLLSKKHVNFFIEHDIKTSFSIDGTEKIHNKMRIYKDGSGSFKDVIRGYNLMRETGKKPMISCTVGNHNVQYLPKISEYFVTELGAEYVGFNILLGCHMKMENKKALIEETIEALLQSFEVLREYGVYEDTVARPLSSLIERKIRYHHCAAYGNQLVVSPSGDIGPCHAFLGSKKYFFGNIFQSTDPTNNEIINMWKNRTPFNLPQCHRCPAISICGGGCAYEAESCNGSFWDIDERYCKFCKKLLDHFLDELYEIYRAKGHN